MNKNYTTNLQAALEYAQRGWAVFPVHYIKEGGCSCGKESCRNAGKHPMTRSGFKDATTDISKIKRWWGKRPDANIGCATGEESGLSVLDVDPRNGGDQTLNFIAPDNIALSSTLCSDTGGGGNHLLFKYFNGAKFGKMPGIDIKSDGGYIVLPPSNHLSGGHYAWRDGECTEPMELASWVPVINTSSVHKVSERTRSNGLGDFEGLIDDGCTEVELKEMLSHISADIDEPEWFRILAAVYSWNNIKGYPIAEAWSKKAVDRYAPGQVRGKWDAFDRDGVSVSVGTLKYKSSIGLRVEQLDGLESLKARVASVANRVELETDVRKEVLKAKLVKIDHDIMIKCFQDKLHALTGVKVPISNVREMLPYTSELGVSDEEQPSWCKQWVYLTLDGKFLKLASRDSMGEKAFNMCHGKDIPWGDGGFKPSAAKWTADRGFLKQAITTNYLPECEDVLCKNDKGQDVVNSYLHALVPVPATQYSDEGKKLIKQLKRHMRLICGNKDDAKVLMQWIAHNIQFPGRQIGWTPLIQSFEGGGKSLFGDIMRLCMGTQNVGVVSASQLLTPFNGWATGVAVNVLEEIRLAGHNRHDALNALKPLITDKSVMITGKGSNGYDTRNTCNYICFTNFRNAVPLNSADRRWWVIFCPYNTLDEFSEEVGDTVEYFNILYDGMREHCSEVHKWLSEYCITDEFLALKTAPMTAAKQAVIATENSSHDGLDMLRDLLATGGKFYNEKVADQASINEALSDAELFDFGTKKVTASFLFRQMGWVSHPSVIKIEGKSRRFWTSKVMTNSEVRKTL